MSTILGTPANVSSTFCGLQVTVDDALLVAK